VVSNRREAAALTFAAAHRVPTRVIPTSSDPDAADAALCAALEGAGVELVVLSGYLRKVGPMVLRRYGGRILNIHPGPLPKYGGAGMYGHAVHAAVAAAGETASAVTIHVVDADYDHGPTVAALAVPLARGDDAEAVEAKVVAAEAGFFVETLKRLAAGELCLPDNATQISDNLP
jgi:phosphoribosylglycinamide formyltransferase-1